MDQKTVDVTNRAGSIRVVASMDGRPMRVDIDPREYANGAEVLAARILELCRLAASRALSLRRAELEKLGFDGNLLARLGLPSSAELADMEIAADLTEGGEPESWLARV